MINNLGRYEIIKEVGRGAMGVVYEAKDPLIDRLVAIKTINLQELGPDERKEYEARFYQEARAAGRLSHPNIVTVHDLGESGGVAYIAMELMEGCELQNLLKDEQRLSVEEALNIAIQVATGLAYAHEHGIVHRDVKPSNIMVLKNNQIKIADFGIARMDTSLLSTQTGKVMGSPLYMSPEQILNRSVDARSDLFSLGTMLFRMLTGKMPFSGDNAHSVMYQIVHENPQQPSSWNPEVPEMLDTIVSKCLAKDPDDRFQNAHKLADELRSCHDMLFRTKSGQDQSSYPLIGRMNKWKLVGIAILIIVLFELVENFLIK
ncbi:MAG: serine/threonine-protein kinase [Gallionellaceae bacterium]